MTSFFSIARLFAAFDGQCRCVHVHHNRVIESEEFPMQIGG